MAHTKESLLERKKNLIAEIEQIFVDAEHWNSSVRAEHEDPIDPDPDGTLGALWASLRKGVSV